MTELLTVSDVARLISTRTGKPVSPRQISDLFYKRYLSDRACPIVGGRRLIRCDYVPHVLSALARYGTTATGDNALAGASP